MPRRLASALAETTLTHSLTRLSVGCSWISLGKVSAIFLPARLSFLLPAILLTGYPQQPNLTSYFWWSTGFLDVISNVVEHAVVCKPTFEQSLSLRCVFSVAAGKRFETSAAVAHVGDGRCAPKNLSRCVDRYSTCLKTIKLAMSSMVCPCLLGLAQRSHMLKSYQSYFGALS